MKNIFPKLLQLNHITIKEVKMKKIYFFTIFLSLFFIYCNPELVTITKNDDSSTTYKLQLGYIVARTGALGMLPCGTLNPEKIVKDNDVQYNLIIDFWTNVWLEIQPGKSLAINVDGKTLTFESEEGSGKNRGYISNKWGKYSEKAWYKCTADDLKKIASGNKIIIKIKGLKWEQFAEFDPEGLANFKEFVKTYVQ